MSPSSSAVLFLIFNRPDLTARVFSAIREAKPARLFIAADGPRAGRPEEFALCKQTRDVTSLVDWDCEVHRLYRDENLGCKLAISGAISWFFEHVPEGIILEDDCLPDATFFSFCEEMLARYRTDQRIGTVTGNNSQPVATWDPSTYYYSIYFHCWGWATWSDRWAHYDREMQGWPTFRSSKPFKQIHPKKLIRDSWRRVLDSCFAGEVDTWDYQWVYSSWAQGYLTVTPGVNLVKNIGFDERATHTKTGEGRKTASISHDVRPSTTKVSADRKKDLFAICGEFGLYMPSPLQRLRRILGKLKAYCRFHSR